MILIKQYKYIKHLKTAQMSSQNLTNGGVGYLFLNYLLKIVYLIPILLLWRTLIHSGVDAGMSQSQMLTYTYLGAILSDVLVVRSPASNWYYDGLFVSLYQRPVSILSHLVSQTVGGWIPQLLLFTLPMIIIAPIFGVSLSLYSLWFIPSLILCVTLGFAVDILFVCLIIRMRNANWLVYVIRAAIVSLLSGSVIPFAILPWGIGLVFQYLPLGSLAGAPLSIYTNLSAPIPIIVAQFFWNILLWPIAVGAFNKTQERMVSYGG